jgi:hypothetical protein
VRTTVNIDDQLLAEAKLLAARTHRTIGSVLEDALRKLMSEQRPEASGRYSLPDFHFNGGLQPGVDLEDKELMAALLGEDRRAPS